MKFSEILKNGFYILVYIETAVKIEFHNEGIYQVFFFQTWQMIEKILKNKLIFYSLVQFKILFLFTDIPDFYIEINIITVVLIGIKLTINDKKISHCYSLYQVVFNLNLSN